MLQQGIMVKLWYILDKKDRGDEHRAIHVSLSLLSFMCMAIFRITLAHSFP